MNDELSSAPITLTVEGRAHGWRVDHYLTRVFPNHSRAAFQQAILAQTILVNGLPVKASRRLRVNDMLSIRLPAEPDRALPAENIPLDVVYEDEWLIVINKPAGMITHPGKGNYRGTLAGALQFHFDRLSDVAGKLRPGIVHRLDRDTSGLLVVAKDNQVHHRLSAQFERREVTKEYRAIVWGIVERDSDYIETWLRVNPREREKMMVCEPGGNARHAVTFYEVLERFYDFSYLKLLPQTGRTHQLRVHARHIGHPIVADRLYGARPALTRSYLGINSNSPADDILISRQALHALRLCFRHPATGAPLEFEASLPPDMQNTLAALRETRQQRK
ncbi:MAG: RluA family pseudouridine synthase [Planctomycetaceae bacterium]